MAVTLNEVIFKLQMLEMLGIDIDPRAVDYMIECLKLSDDGSSEYKSCLNQLKRFGSKAEE